MRECSQEEGGTAVEEIGGLAFKFIVLQISSLLTRFVTIVPRIAEPAGGFLAGVYDYLGTHPR